MAILLIILPASLHAQETDREQVLADDIKRLGERALRDRVISDEEHTQMLCFVRDSLPEGTDLKVRALEQIRDELDEKYSEKVHQAQKLLDEMGYIGRQMLPDRLYEPEDLRMIDVCRGIVLHPVFICGVSGRAGRILCRSRVEHHLVIEEVTDLMG